MNTPTNLPHSDQRFGCLTYAQNGEDLVVCNVFALLGINKASYLDLGCHHPSNISNTRLFYERGWRGVCVDANVHVGGDFRRERPEDTFVCIGVGPVNETRTFAMFDHYSGRNTFVADEIDVTLKLHPDMKVTQTRELRCTTIADIVVNWCGGRTPAFVSCDLEGLDYEALGAFDFTVFGIPEVVCVEARQGFPDERMSRLMREKGMERLLRMGDNLIFVRKGVLGWL